MNAVEIEGLTGHGHLAELLAGWHVAEFGHLYDESVWNLSIARTEFATMAASGAIDRTWVAFAGSGRAEGDVLGSISLVATDDLAGFEHLSPWLASLYIAPPARGQGLGSRLVEHVVDVAREEGHDYVHLFTAGQERYYLVRGWRHHATVTLAGETAAVMTRSTSARGARRAVCSHWNSNPDVGGAYSYLRVGGDPTARDTLAGPILPGLWLAGEATSRAYPATMHGAWFSGERAADQVLADGARSVLVIGAGIAGLAAARRLTAAGAGVAATVLEAADRPGGRVAVDASIGRGVPLGAAWLHGSHGHPLAPYVTARPENWTNQVTFVHGSGELTAADRKLAERARTDLGSAFATADPASSVGAVMADLMPTLTYLTATARTAVHAWLRSEIENLFAGRLDDFSARHGFEPYMFEGPDALVTSGLAEVPSRLAEGLDVRCDHRIASLTHDGGQWTTDTGEAADAVIVTVSIAAMKSGRLRITPPLPDAVLAALDQLGTGTVTKLFTTYDERWWPTDRRPIRFAGDTDVMHAIDVTEVTGVPTLCWMTVGATAIAIESMTEDEQCRLVDDVARSSGLAGSYG